MDFKIMERPNITIDLDKNQTRKLFLEVLVKNTKETNYNFKGLKLLIIR